MTKTGHSIARRARTLKQLSLQSFHSPERARTATEAIARDAMIIGNSRITINIRSLSGRPNVGIVRYPSIGDGWSRFDLYLAWLFVGVSIRHQADQHASRA